jgi:hypothetical protein
MNAHFDISDALHLYDQLNEHPVEHWRERWTVESSEDSSSAGACRSGFVAPTRCAGADLDAFETPYTPLQA